MITNCVAILMRAAVAAKASRACGQSDTSNPPCAHADAGQQHIGSSEGPTARVQLRAARVAVCVQTELIPIKLRFDCLLRCDIRVIANYTHGAFNWVL